MNYEFHSFSFARTRLDEETKLILIHARQTIFLKLQDKIRISDGRKNCQISSKLPADVISFKTERTNSAEKKNNPKKFKHTTILHINKCSIWKLRGNSGRLIFSSPTLNNFHFQLTINMRFKTDKSKKGRVILMLFHVCVAGQRSIYIC